MDVLNMNSHPVSVQLTAPNGSVDHAMIQPKRRASLPPGFTVDTNWLSVQVNIRVYNDDGSTFTLRPIPLPAVAPAPAPAPTPEVKAN